MNKSESTKLLSSLLKQDAEQVQFWLKQVLMGQQQVPENFNWHGLAEVAASEATNLSRLSSNKRLSLIWAGIAISIYESLIKEENKDEAKESFLHSLMNLKSCMIVRFGSANKDLILDPTPIIDWFFDSLNISYEEAIEKSSNWKEIFRSLNSEETDFQIKKRKQEILELRLIKNRLKIIKSLVDSNQFSPNEQLKSWLSIRKKLP
ncbi:hypothetical protein [Lusitaniella coriacea]|uniref:hypothetical protein n=1 Tax=Lusitaniella coriacea TaxID=1983105 RepID=UPI003CEA1C77